MLSQKSLTVYALRALGPRWTISATGGHGRLTAA